MIDDDDGDELPSLDSMKIFEEKQKCNQTDTEIDSYNDVEEEEKKKKKNELKSKALTRSTA